MTQLFAKIKKSSRFFSQNILAKRDGQFPFPVVLQPDRDGYVVKGGPGANYKIADVEFYAVIDGKEVRIK